MSPPDTVRPCPHSPCPWRNHHPESERWWVQVTEIKTAQPEGPPGGCERSTEDPHLLQAAAGVRKPSLPLGPPSASPLAPRRGILL